MKWDMREVISWYAGAKRRQKEYEIPKYDLSDIMTTRKAKDECPMK